MKHSTNTAYSFILQVPQLSEEEAERLLNSILHETDRTLQPEQKGRVIEKILCSPTPLYVSLIRSVVLSLKHNDVVLLPASLKEAIADIFKEAERVNGRPLVEKVVLFLVCCKTGLTESELLDLLALDRKVSKYI